MLSETCLWQWIYILTCNHDRYGDVIVSLPCTAIRLLDQKCFSDSVFFFAVLWVVAIIGVCYDVTKLIEVSGVHVYYEYGCYTITAAGRKLIQSDS
jgi:hypothetical protein